MVLKLYVIVLIAVMLFMYQVKNHSCRSDLFQRMVRIIVSLQRGIPNLAYTPPSPWYWTWQLKATDDYFFIGFRCCALKSDWQRLSAIKVQNRIEYS